MDYARSIEADKTAGARDCCAPAGNSRWLNRRNALIAVALTGSAGALFFGWDWLMAAGVASIIVAMAPCLIMCALGLCMSRKSGTPPVARPDAQRATQPAPTGEPSTGNQK